MLKPCKIKDLHTPTLNTPEYVPSPRAATAFTKAQPALHNTSSTTHSLLLPPHTPYYSHFQQPFRLHIPIHLHSFHTSLHPHFLHHSLHLTTPSLLPFLTSLSTPSTSTLSTTPSTSTTHCQQTHIIGKINASSSKCSS